MLRSVFFSSVCSALFASTVASAGDLTLEMTLPRLTVAEYHRPYIAIWIAREDNTVAQHLAVLYDLDMENQEGEKWLKDMRQWWRRGGRKLSMPIDGVSGATIGPGRHTLEFSQQLDSLPAGEYRLMVEASREVGGREVVNIPFQWPVAAATRLDTTGNAELGALALQLQP